MSGPRIRSTSLVALGLATAAVAVASLAVTAQGTTGASSRSGWTIPATAETEKNPLPTSEAIVGAGRKLFVSKCQRCHGSQGKGNGPDADKKRQADMDLTVAARAADNPDGVVFYKIWNGRSSPRMPKLSEEFTREQVWAVVVYVQTLRGK